MSNGIRAPSPEFRTQVIPGRCKLHLMLAIACFGLLLSEAYVIGQPINGIDVDGEIAKIRGGEHSEMPLPEKDRADDDETVTYEFRNETERRLLVLLKGQDKRALIVEPGSFAQTDVMPGSYEVAVRGWADDEYSVKPWYNILDSAGGMLYQVKFSAVTVYPCNIVAVQDRSVPGRPVIFRGSVDSRVLNEYELEQAEYKFFFGDGNVRDWSKEASAEHVYSVPGIYEAALEVRSGDKDYTSRRAIITIDREEPIAVSLRATPVKPKTGQVVAFSAVPEGDTEGFEYKFDFGDGSVEDWSSEARAEHVYSLPGRYTPYVIARIGERTLESGRIAINVERMPIAVFLRAEPVKPKTDQVVIFRAIREVDVEGIEYNFDFGDGEVRDWSSEAIANHAYGKEGEYSAYVKARLGDTVTDSSPVTIQVMMDYEVAIYARSQRAREGDEVIFREGDKTIFRKGDEIVFGAVLTPEARGASFRFDLGDNSPTGWTEKSEVEHAYSSPGRYTPYVIARIGERTFQSGRIAINVERKIPYWKLILLLLGLIALCLIAYVIYWAFIAEGPKAKILPPEERSKITGNANLNLGYFRGDIYNGSDWNITRLKFRVVAKAQDGSIRWDRELDKATTISPLTAEYVSILDVPVGRDIASFVWHIDTAWGYRSREQ